MPDQRPWCALVSITRAAIRNWIRRYAHGPNLTLFCPKPSLFRHKTALTGSISSFVVPVRRESDLASWGARSDMAATPEHVLQSHHRQISGRGDALCVASLCGWTGPRGKRFTEPLLHGVGQRSG